jgi:hypothetical protein
MDFGKKNKCSNVNFMNRFLVVFLLVLFVSATNNIVQAKTQNIVMWYKIFNEKHTRQLLHNVFDDSINNLGHYKLLPSHPITQGRAFIELANDSSLDIMTAAPSLSREQSTYAIPVPINRGLLGVRICLLHKGNTDKFQHIETLQDIIDNKILFGQGTHWPDTQILRANGLRVFTSPLHENLHNMLRAGRFDCFPRAISEVDDELERYGRQGIEIEGSFAIVYKLPLYYWFNSENNALIQRVRSGLLKSIADRTYHEINRQSFEAIIKKYNIESRNIIYLNNPKESELVKTTEGELWHPMLQKHFKTE